MPVLCLALRRREGYKFNPAMQRAQMAINAVHLHAAESDWTTNQYNGPYASPDYVEALIQLADEARWGPQEVRLPRHPAPHHPPIYYSRELGTNCPIPRQDSLIRGDFVYGPTGRLLTRDDSLTRMDLARGHAYRRITRNEYIHPVFDPSFGGTYPDELVAKGWDAFYSLVELTLGNPEVIIHWLVQEGGRSIARRMRLRRLWFSRYPPRFFTN